MAFGDKDSKDSSETKKPGPASAGEGPSWNWRTSWRFFRARIWAPLADTWDRFQRDDGTLMAAATSFYAGLSLMPLLIVLVSGLGLILETTEFGADARQKFLESVEAGGSTMFRQQVERLLANISEGAAVGGPLGLAGLVFGAMAIFAQFERAFDRIWNVETPQNLGVLKAVRRILMERFRAFLMLCGLGLLILAIFIAGITLSALEEFAAQWWPVPRALRRVTEWGVSLSLNTLAFTLLYRLLPKVEVRWREALWGGLLVAVGWEIGRQVLSAILVRTHYINAYGTIGSFLAVLFWLYYASHLLFLGAEFIQSICKRCDPEPDSTS